MRKRLKLKSQEYGEEKRKKKETGDGFSKAGVSL